MAIEINSQGQPRGSIGQTALADGTRIITGSLTLVAGTAAQVVPNVCPPGGAPVGELFVSRNAPGGVIGDLSVAGAVNPDGSVTVTVTSANAGDTSTVSWAFVGFGKRP